MAKKAKREFQLRVQFDSDQAEEVYNFTTLKAATHAFYQHSDVIADSYTGEDAHLEVIEVLMQEHVRALANEN